MPAPETKSCVSRVLGAARSNDEKFPAWRDLDLQELKDELATKFVVGLGIRLVNFQGMPQRGWKFPEISGNSHFHGNSRKYEV